VAGDSGQKTEKPTPKKLKEARRKGQIPRSPDLVGWLTLLIVSFTIPSLMRGVRRVMDDYLATAYDAIKAGTPEVAMTESSSVLTGIAVVLMPFLGLIMLLTIAGLAVQGGVTLTGEPLKPKLERISIKAGVKRLFSAQSAVDTVKAVFRLIVLAVLVTQITVGYVNAYLHGSSRALGPAAIDIGAALLLLVQLAAAIGVVVGLADYAFQRHKTAKQLRMSKQEIKQEGKNTEGDPQVRGRRRAMHAKLNRNQMLAAVSEASVVVVNPTHVAVALAYAPGEVPRVVAKGGDDLAFRIRERAFEAGVPVIETRPLARVLHDLLDIGEEVPADLYEAVAIVIAFVMRTPPATLDKVVRRVSVPRSKLGDRPTD